ncbi:hypothetical protein C8J57DRAFT_1099681 [Mycena rebaudengoi]|nr:hypothetical protein C8J57DRAFT_1099681 [Mycena rebaudengoi]
MDLNPPLQVPLQQVLNATSELVPQHHILSGSFRSLSLFLLVFSPLQRTLDHVQTIKAFGPHQYIGLGPRIESAESSRERHVYTTSWATPPELQSWAVERKAEGMRVRWLDSVGISRLSATSSYVTVPPPYSHIYSAGGPSAQVHAINPDPAHGFGKHVQEVLFVKEDEWDAADKTRKALRYGSHGVEFALPVDATALAFIPVLGTSTIEIYSRAPDGSLVHIQSSPAPLRDSGVAEEDGPRHVKVHPNGKVLYCVTEHSNYLDVYRITSPNGHETSQILTHVASRSLIPPRLRSPAGGTGAATHTFRGDTLLLTPSTPARPAPDSIFATTRGGEGEETRGWLGVWRLDENGLFADPGENPEDSAVVERYEAPTTGGKAHALDLLIKSEDNASMWVLMTDDSPPHPGVRVLEWDGWLEGVRRIREVVAWPPADFVPAEGDEVMAGGSHAVWLD